MSKPVLAKQARKDLMKIRRHTVDRWGKEQARKYISLIHDCADDLANRRLRGKSREVIVHDLKSYHVGRHVVFYVESEQGIDIAIILHDAMDFSRHFK